MNRYQTVAIAIFSVAMWSGKAIAVPVPIKFAQSSSADTGSSAASESTEDVLLQRIELLESQVEALTEQLQQLTVESDGSEDEAIAPTPEDEAVAAVEEQIARQENALLLPPGQMEGEFSISYAHSSTDTLSIDGFSVLPVFVVGEIVSERIRRQSVIPAFTFRLGLPADWQLNLRVPYALEMRNQVTGEDPPQERSDSNSGIGDIEFGFSKQLGRESRGWADWLWRVNWKTTTGADPFEVDNANLALGSGFHGLQTNVTFIKATDPAVLFGSLGYTFNLEANKPSGAIDPGDTLSFSLGMGLALSNALSVNFGWEQRFTSSTSFNGRKVDGTSLSVGNFTFGASYQFAPERWTNFNLSIGLTEDAPDFQLTTSVPFSIN